MSIHIQPVNTKKDRKDFVNFQFQLYKGHPLWVPPLKADEIHALEPEHNLAFAFCEAAFWLAYRDGKAVGRIGAIINNRYNEKTGKKLGRFTRLEFIDDKEVFQALMDTAAAWLKKRKMNIIHGPLGFTNLDNQGLLIEGFEHLPSVASVYHLPYYKKHLEAYGFEKEIDWLEFRLKLGETAIKKSIRGAEMLKKRYGYDVVKFTNIKDLTPYAEPLFNIVNQAFERLPFVSPFSPEMIRMYTKKYFKAVNPHYVFFVEKDHVPVGFMFTVPSLSKAMQKANGKLFPFGFYHIIKARNNPEVIDFFLGGVVPEHENHGVAVILYAEVQKQMMADGIDTVETTGNLETNTRVIANWKNFNHIQHKRRRCFVKSL